MRCVTRVTARSDDNPAVLAAGTADVDFAVLSMSEREPNGQDDAYLDWHLLDHLPEQYRIDGLRLGQRWRSSDSCRAARAASEPPYDRVDHVVGYLFGAAVDAALATFFDLGASLHRAGRMPLSLPRVEVTGWEVMGRVAAPRVLVGADVVPWRPHRGMYLIIESIAETATGHVDELDALAGIDGVAGVWRYRNGGARHQRLRPFDGAHLTICYLDGEPTAVAAALAAPLRARWREKGITPLLAAPFDVVLPFDHTPGRCT